MVFLKETLETHNIRLADYPTDILINNEGDLRRKWELRQSAGYPLDGLWVLPLGGKVFSGQNGSLKLAIDANLGHTKVLG